MKDKRSKNQKRLDKLNKRDKKKKVNKQKSQVKVATQYMEKTQKLMNLVSSKGENQMFDTIIENKDLIGEIVSIVSATVYYKRKEVEILSFITGMESESKPNKDNILLIFKYIVNLLNNTTGAEGLAQVIVLNMPVLGYFINEYDKEIESNKK